MSKSRKNNKKSGRASPKLLKKLSNKSNKVENFIENISGIPSNTTLRQRKKGLKHLKNKIGNLENQDRKRRTRGFRMNMTKYKNEKEAYRKAQQLAAQAEGGIVTAGTPPNKKLKMEGGGDGEFDMQADATTSSSQGALDSSVSDQNSRNNTDNELKGQYGGAGSFIPPAGMDGGDAMSLKGVADSITQGKASAIGDNDIPGKPCGDDVATGGRKRRRRKSLFLKKRTKKRRKRKKRRRSRKRGKSSRRIRGYVGKFPRRTRKRLKKLRFSKMPPKYL